MSDNAKRLAILMLCFSIGIVLLVLNWGPNLNLLKSQFISPMHTAPIESIALIPQFSTSPPSFTIFSKALKSAPESFTLVIFPVKSLTLQNTVAYKQLQPTDIQNIHMNAGAVTMESIANTVALNIVLLPTDVQTTSVVGSFSLNLGSEELLALEYDIIQQGIRSTKLVKSFPNESLRISGIPFTNETGEILSISTSDGIQVLEPLQTVYTKNQRIMGYTVLKENTLTQFTLDPPPRTYRSSLQIRKPLSGGPNPQIKVVNNHPIIPVSEMAQFNTLILSLTDRQGVTRHFPFDVRNGSPLRAPLSWEDLPDVYSSATYRWAFGDESSSSNSALLQQLKGIASPDLASINYLSAGQDLRKPLIDSAAEPSSQKTVTFTPATGLLISVVHTERFLNLSQAIASLRANKHRLAVGTQGSSTFNSQLTLGGQPLVLNTLTRQAVVISQPVTDPELTVTFPTDLNIIPSTATSSTSSSSSTTTSSQSQSPPTPPFNPITSIFPPGSQKQLICLIKKGGEWESLPVHQQPLLSPISCWEQAQAEGNETFTLQFLTYLPQTQELEAFPQGEAFIPALTQELKVLSYNPNNGSGSLNQSGVDPSTLKAVFYENLTLTQSKVESVLVDGLTWSPQAIPSFCSTKCYLRVVRQIQQSNKVYLQSLSSLLIHQPGKSVALEFCPSNSPLLASEDLDGWTLKAPSLSLPLTKTANNCLSFTSNTAATTSSSAPQLTFGDNLLENADFAQNFFEPLPASSPLPPRRKWYKSDGIDWSATGGENGKEGLELFHQGTEEKALIQIVDIPSTGSTLYQLKATGRIEPPPLNETTCKLSLVFYDAQMTETGKSELSFSVTGQFHTRETRLAPPSNARFVAVKLYAPLTSTPKNKICVFSSAELREQTSSQNTQSSLSLASLLLTSQQFREFPEGSLLLTNLPTAPPQTPFASIKGKYVPYQQLLISDNLSSHAVYFASVEVSHPLLLTPTNRTTIMLPPAPPTPLHSVIQPITQLTPISAGTSIITENWSQLVSPFELPDSPANPSYISFEYPRGSSVAVPHIAHGLTNAQIFATQLPITPSSLHLQFTTLPGSTSMLSFQDIIRPEVSLLPQVTGQKFFLSPANALTLSQTAGTINLPILYRLTIPEFSLTAFSSLSTPIPLNARIAEIPHQLELTFNAVSGFPTSTAAFPILLTTAQRGAAYSGSLPFQSLLQTTQLSYTLSNPTFQQTDCAALLSISLTTQIITGSIPQGLSTTSCDFSVTLTYTESTGPITHQNTSIHFLKIPISSSPPTTLTDSSEYFLPQNSSFAPIIIPYSSGLRDVTFNAASSHQPQNGISLNYSQQLKSIIISGPTQSFSAAQTITIAARDPITYRNITHAITLRPKALLAIPIIIVQGFTNTIPMTDRIKAAVIAQLQSYTNSSTTSTTASSTSTSTTSSSSSSLSLSTTPLSSVSLINLTAVPSSLPSYVLFQPTTKLLVVSENQTVTGNEAVKFNASINGSPTDITITFTTIPPTQKTLPAVIALRGADFHLNLNNYLREQETIQSPVLQMNVEAPAWLHFNGSTTVSGRVPSALQNDTLKVREQKEFKIYTIPITGQNIPTVPPSTSTSASTSTTQTTSATTTLSTTASTTITTATTGSVFITSTTSHSAPPTTSTSSTVSTTATTTSTTSTTTPPLTGCFPDLTGIPSSYEAGICAAFNLGIVQGSGGSFNPTGEITRAAATKVLITGPGFLQNVTNQSEMDQLITWYGFLPTVTYTDVPGTEWYMPYIIKATLLNIVNGYPDGSYKPGNSLNAAEAAKLIVNTLLTLSPKDSPLLLTYTSCLDPLAPWYYPYLKTLNFAGGDLPEYTNTTELEKPISRAQFIYNIMALLAPSSTATEASLCEPLIPPSSTSTTSSMPAISTITTSSAISSSTTSSTTSTSSATR